MSDQARKGISDAIGSHFADDAPAPAPQSNEQAAPPAPPEAPSAPPTTPPPAGDVGTPAPAEGAQPGKPTPPAPPAAGTERISLGGNDLEVPAAVAAAYREMQADYTRKTQAVAEARREAEAHQAAIQNAERQVFEREAKLEERLKALEADRAAAEAQADVDPEVARAVEPLKKQMGAEIQALRQELARVDAWRREASDREIVAATAEELRGIVSETTKAFPDVRPAYLAAVVRDLLPPNPTAEAVREAFRTVAKEEQGRVDEIRKKARDEVFGRKADAPVAAGGVPSAAPAPPPPRPKDLREAVRLTVGV